MRVCASILPKEIEISRPLDGLSDEDLTAMIEVLKTELAKGLRQTAHDLAHDATAEDTGKPTQQ
jgi:hypothetical protein